jgi:hypothetical protein
LSLEPFDGGGVSPVAVDQVGLIIVLDEVMKVMSLP